MSFEAGSGWGVAGRGGSEVVGRELPEGVLNHIQVLCSHPQLANYRRDARGRRGAIYIPSNQPSLVAIHSFSSGVPDGFSRRGSFSG